MTKEDLIENLEDLVKDLEENGGYEMGSDAFVYARLLRAVGQNIQYGSPKIVVKHNEEY